MARIVPFYMSHYFNLFFQSVFSSSRKEPLTNFFPLPLEPIFIANPSLYFLSWYSSSVYSDDFTFHSRARHSTALPCPRPVCKILCVWTVLGSSNLLGDGFFDCGRLNQGTAVKSLTSHLEEDIKLFEHVDAERVLRCKASVIAWVLLLKWLGALHWQPSPNQHQLRVVRFQ